MSNGRRRRLRLHVLCSAQFLRVEVSIASLRAFLRSTLLLLALAAIIVGPALADAIRVKRNVNLRADPSSYNDPIRLMTPGETADLLDATAVGGYLHVRTPAGEEGWVWKKNVDVEAGAAPPPPAAGAPASSISPSWDKPAPQTADFHLHGKTCGPTGNPGDTETNRRKNRIDVPAAYHAVTFDAVDQLPYPDASTKRYNWTSAQLAAIAPYEGVALTVTGYLVAFRSQAGNSEACNCGWTSDDETDWHMALVGQAGELEKDALVVETTPRIRRDHPNWTTVTVSSWKGKPDPIRVSGWLMMDPQHKAHLHPHGTTPAYRNTLWEIHPITRIEVYQQGEWKDLDALP